MDASVAASLRTHSLNDVRLIVDQCLCPVGSKAVVLRGSVRRRVEALLRRGPQFICGEAGSVTERLLPRRKCSPIAPKPNSIIAQVAGSGTPPCDPGTENWVMKATVKNSHGPLAPPGLHTESLAQIQFDVPATLPHGKLVA